MKLTSIFIAAMMMATPSLQSQLVNDGATNILGNVTNNIPGGMTVGTNGSFTLLVLSNNCLLTNSGISEIGRNTTARSNEVRLTRATARWHMLNPLHVGVNGSFNRLAISNGAVVQSSQGVIGSSSASASNNTVIVNGAGSVWSVATSFIVGLIGNSNRLEVSDGGRVNADSGSIGEVASNNVVLVTGSGSVWSNAIDLMIGSSRSSNRLVVSNAGSVFVGGTVLLGNLAASSNNQLTVNGGTLRVTNALATGTLNVRRGTATLDAGLIEVDRLLVTNSQGSFVLNGGTLSSKSTIATNQFSFDIGNNIGAATFILAGNGTHTFTALTVDNMGTLTGNGTVVLPAPNLVVVLDTGTISPGASIGKMAFSNQLLVFGTTLMEISRNGAVLTNDQIQISGGLSHNGHLTITNIGPTPFAAGDRFLLFTAPFSTASLLSLTLPPLGTGLTWTNKFALDGSIEVLGLIVQTLPATAVGTTNATLNGLVNPGGNSATAWFEYGFTTNYGNVTAPQALGSGVNPTNISQVLTGLFGGVTFHFRAVGSNSFGLVFGSDQSFTLPAFVNTEAGLPGKYNSVAAWGDFNNDGRLDFVISGVDFSNPTAQLWRNTGSNFVVHTTLGSRAIHTRGSVAWGDSDNDNDLDLLIAGADGLMLLRNPGFDSLGVQPLQVFSAGTACWGDFDSAGRLDILFVNQSSQKPGLLLNAGSGFASVGAGLPVTATSPVAGADLDNDGDLDISLQDSNGDFGIQVLRNTGGQFTNINAGFPTNVIHHSSDWGDYDNDGKLDLLVTSRVLSQTNVFTEVWRNTGSGFSNITAGLPGVIYGSAAWGDYDNDGRLDILLMGTTNVDANFDGDPSTGIAQVWRNTGSGFANINVGLTNVSYGVATWGDYDNDGRLDILLCGTNRFANNTNRASTQVWRNNTAVSNTPPSVPNGLSFTHTASGTVMLNWNAASDAQTPSAGLSYNVRIGTTPGGIDVAFPMSSSNGFRLVPQRGSAQTCLTFKPSPGTTYYWSVQAVDTAFAGSAFSTEASFAFHGALGPPGSTNAVPGDQNGDGVVSQSELAAVLTNLNGSGILTESDLQLILTNYFSHSPFLQMTNVAGLGGSTVTFALTNDLAGDFSVEFTTNFLDWYFLGPATPRYLFTDTNAPAVPERYYRLRWP